MTHPTTEPSLLSIADLSRRLALPESTTRYYCKRFAAHLPHTGEGRKRRYYPECVDILTAIAGGMRQNKNALAVDFALQATAPQKARPVMLEPVPALSSQLMDLMERQTEALQQIAAAMTLFASRPSEPPALPAGGEAAEALRQEIDALRGEMSAAEQGYQRNLDQMRKWLARFSEAMAKRPL